VRNLYRALGADLPVDAIVVQQVVVGPGGEQDQCGLEAGDQPGGPPREG
jgi:hypothetical protein